MNIDNNQVLCFMELTGLQNPQNVQEYLYPSFSMYHIQISMVSMLIAYSWILFFLGFFKRNLNFSHSILIPANISILPIYILHQTLIIIIGFYVVELELNTAFKFVIIAITAIPAAVLIYKLIQTNNVTRFLFGMKKKASKKALVPQSTFVNSQTAQLQPIVQSVADLRNKKHETI